MKALIVSLCLMVFACGCTVLKPFTGNLEKSAMKVRQSQGWVESKVTPGLYGAPQAANPDWLSVAMTPAQVAQDVYPVKYPLLRGLEVSLDGLGVVGAGYVAYEGIRSVTDEGDGDSTSTSSTDNRSTKTSTTSTDRHDTALDVSAGDNSPVTVIYQSQTGPAAE